MTATAPEISVVIPVHNGDRYLAASIQSGLDQGHAALELLVIDNGSTDATAAVAGTFSRRLGAERRHGTKCCRPGGLGALEDALPAGNGATAISGAVSHVVRQFDRRRGRPRHHLADEPGTGISWCSRSWAPQETTIEPSSPMAALRALAPSTLLQLPGEGRETMTRLSALVRRVPAYTLNAGTHMGGIAQNVEALLKQLCSVA
jgi:hypothetical protein